MGNEEAKATPEEKATEEFVPQELAEDDDIPRQKAVVSPMTSGLTNGKSEAEASTLISTTDFSLSSGSGPTNNDVSTVVQGMVSVSVTYQSIDSMGEFPGYDNAASSGSLLNDDDDVARMMAELQQASEIETRSKNLPPATAPTLIEDDTPNDDDVLRMMEELRKTSQPGNADGAQGAEVPGITTSTSIPDDDEVLRMIQEMGMEAAATAFGDVAEVDATNDDEILRMMEEIERSACSEGVRNEEAPTNPVATGASGELDDDAILKMMQDVGAMVNKEQHGKQGAACN